MAAEYLTLEEVCETLGVDATQVKAMVAEGRLHEFRDAGKVFFKRAEIDKMAAKEGSSIVDLAAADELALDTTGSDNESFASALSSLADSSSSLGLGDISPAAAAATQPPSDQPSELSLMDEPSPAAASGSGMGLSPMEMSPEDFPQELPAAPAAKELTSEIDLLPTDEEETKPAPASKPAAAAQVPDLGLSGSSIINLTPAGGEEEAPPKPTAKAAPGKSISVFEDDEVEIAVDPMGETRISAGVDELEAVGSGSGLLDLTQVNDDTSLGAELLDVISPTATEGEATETEAEVVEAAETVEDSGAIIAETMPDEAPALAAPTSVTTPAAGVKVAAYSSAAMPGESWINLTLLLGILSTALVGLCAAGQLQGVWPGFLAPIARDVGHYATFGGLALLAIVFGVLGILAGRK